jgi:hypothetical protein
MNPSLPLLAALLLAPLAALYAAEPPRKILFRLKNGELRH